VYVQLVLQRVNTATATRMETRMRCCRFGGKADGSVSALGKVGPGPE
jgi:hypothetical protein